MNTADFIQLVRDLRQAQADYKRSRRYDDQYLAEELGRKVDAALKDYETPTPTKK